MWSLKAAIEWAEEFSRENRIPFFTHTVRVNDLSPALRRGGAFFSNPSYVRVPHLNDAPDFAVLLHEFGHLMDDRQFQLSRRESEVHMLLCERRAWEWAATTPHWHEGLMAARRVESLRSYLKPARSFPPETDPIFQLAGYQLHEVRKLIKGYPLLAPGEEPDPRWRDLL